MRVHKALSYAVSVALVGLLAVAVGCEVVREYDYYDGVKESGLTTGEKTDLPDIMAQMRTANLHLVDSLIYMHSENVMRNSVQIYELARAMKQSQPAVALQSPNDVAEFKKLADDLSEIIVQVGAAARDNRMELADWHYTQAFPTCNRCHVKFRGVTAPKPVTIPEIERPIEPVPEPGTTEEPAAPEEGATEAPVEE